MAEPGVRGEADGSADSDVCSAKLGMRRDWSDGTYSVTCNTCGSSFREVTDAVSGETVILHRAGIGWVEWPGASSLTVVVDGRVPHPRGSKSPRSGRVHQREANRDRAKRVRK